MKVLLTIPISLRGLNFPLKQHLHRLFSHALKQLQIKGDIPQNITLDIHLERTRNVQHGDFACNVAMMLAKATRMRPRDLATRIVAALPTNDEYIAKIEIAGPGFINIFLTLEAYHRVVNDILTDRDTYGHLAIGTGQSVMIEFVSANPTGPLHVGHGRSAAYGAALAHLLTIAGFTVHKEYYVNDAGRQMDILATSIWLRYLELCGETITFPLNAYQGDYIWDIAASLHREQGESLRQRASLIFESIPPDADQGGDKEQHIDALIQRSQQLLGKNAYQTVLERGLFLRKYALI